MESQKTAPTYSSGRSQNLVLECKEDPEVSFNTRSRKRNSTTLETEGEGPSLRSRKRPSFASTTSNIGALIVGEGLKPLSPLKKIIRRSGREDLNHQYQTRASSTDAYRRSRKSEPGTSRCSTDVEISRQIKNDIYFPSVRDLPYSHFASPSFTLYRRNKTDCLSGKGSKPKMNNFDVLPDEMVLKIFKFLPKSSLGSCASVSKRFHRLVEDETLWKRVDALGKILSGKELSTILNRKPHYLRLARAMVQNELGWIEDASQLLYLDLSMAILPTKALTDIFSVSKNLVKLSLEHVVVSKEVVESMGTFAKSIETLNMCMCYDVNPNTLAQFLMHCYRLKELNIGCLKMDWSAKELSNVINALPSSIIRLNVAGFRGILSDDHVLDITKRCPHLEELDVSDGHELTTASVEHISKGLVDLEHLSLSRCYNIVPTSYTMLASMKSLKYLDIFSLFKESSIKTLSNTLPSMKINHFPFSTVARPTVGVKRSSIWLQRVRD